MKKYSGKISTLLLILGAILIVVIIIVFLVIKTTATKKSATTNPVTPVTTVTAPVLPVYDGTIENIRFVVQSAQDLGRVMVSPVPVRGQSQTLTTTERYIKVTIGAQNKGNFNTFAQAWKIGNIIDSDGRNFISINNQARAFLPNPNLCGIVLKPEFDLVPCVSFYEVSKESKGLKIQVSAVANAKGSKPKEGFLDLNI